MDPSYFRHLSMKKNAQLKSRSVKLQYIHFAFYLMPDQAYWTFNSDLLATPRTISLLLSHYHPLSIERVLLLITPYHFISFPFCRLRESHNTPSHVCFGFVLDAAIINVINKNFPLPTRICRRTKHNRYQRNFSGLHAREEIS